MVARPAVHQTLEFEFGPETPAFGVLIGAQGGEIVGVGILCRVTELTEHQPFPVAVLPVEAAPFHPSSLQRARQETYPRPSR